MWKQHLFSKKIRNSDGTTAEFDVLTDGTEDDYEHTIRITQRPGRTLGRHAAFIVDCGDRFYIGVNGRVLDALGKDYAYAYEQPLARDGTVQKGREITFVHGYFAPKNTPIPDITELLDVQPKHLDEILTRANAGETPVKAETVDFKTSPKAGSEWHRIVTEFKNGKYKGQGATFTPDGKLYRMLDAPASAQAAPAPSAQPTSSFYQDPAQKKTLPESVNHDEASRRAFLRTAGTSLLVVIGGWLAWILIDKWRKRDDEKKKHDR